MREGLPRAFRRADPSHHRAIVAEEDQAMGVTVDDHDAILRVDRQHMGVEDVLGAEGPDEGALRVELDDGVRGGIDQRVEPQQHEDVAAAVAGDVADQARPRSKSPKGRSTR